jgi:hypothetical protein
LGVRCVAPSRNLKWSSMLGFTRRILLPPPSATAARRRPEVHAERGAGDRLHARSRGGIYCHQSRQFPSVMPPSRPTGGHYFPDALVLDRGNPCRSSLSPLARSRASFSSGGAAAADVVGAKRWACLPSPYRLLIQNGYPATNGAGPKEKPRRGGVFLLPPFAFRLYVPRPHRPQ